jgi:hypothetical protein
MHDAGYKIHDTCFRNPKSESLNPKQIQNSNIKTPPSPQSEIRNVMAPVLHHSNLFYSLLIPQSLAQTDHIVRAVYLVLVCKKVSNVMLESAPGRAEI